MPGEGEGDDMSDVDRLFDRRDEIDRAAQVFGAAARSTARGYEGQDESRSVTVRLTPEGRLDDVRIAVSWQRHLGVAELSAAVLGAVATAGLSRLEEWGTAMDTALSGPAPSLRPAEGLYDTLAGQLEDHVRSARSPGEVAAIEGALVEVMAELVSTVDELTEQVDEALSASVRGESGRDRHVVAELSLTGEILGITYDERWLEKAHPANIGRATMAAVDAAGRELAGRSVSDVIASSRLQQLQTLLNDPVAVSQRLGL